METRQQRLIRQALEHGTDKNREVQEPEASLRDLSLAHTDPDYVPRTLTPHEWESYYADHGVPSAHRQRRAVEPGVKAPGSRGMLSCLSRLFRPSNKP